jgi:hypothetical protein
LSLATWLRRESKGIEGSGKKSQLRFSENRASHDITFSARPRTLLTSESSGQLPGISF